VDAIAFWGVEQDPGDTEDRGIRDDVHLSNLGVDFIEHRVDDHFKFGGEVDQVGKAIHR
jgi:hypothetical protein